MSEYQYYEFQVLDRPLTKAQIEDLEGYSSRAEVTSRKFTVVYNYGDFKGDPDYWMEKYFDLFLYLANWGTHWFMVRVPKKLLKQDIVKAYCTEESFEYHSAGGNLILSFRHNDEEYTWAEGEGWLDSLVPLRADLMRGDYRCLYLGWLLGAQSRELDDRQIEPPVPPGLGDLSDSLQSLADFLEIDPDLIASAAERSPKRVSFELSREDISRWVADLPAKDKDAVIARIIEEDIVVTAEIKQRAYQEIRDSKRSGKAEKKEPRRSVGQLLKRADEIYNERKKREAEREAKEKARQEKALAAARKKHLESLIGREDAIWAEVDKLIALKQAKPYTDAVSHLLDLKDLSDKQGKQADFSSRMNALGERHTSKPALRRRFKEAGLI